MPVVITPETEFAKERAKWEAEGGPWGAPGKRWVFKEYPQAMYKVTERNPLQTEFMTADNETEKRNLESRGFVAGGPGKAVEAYDAQQRTIAEAAANRAYGELRMSPEARAEAQQYESEADGHVAEIPEMPIRRKPGRPPKAKE